MTDDVLTFVEGRIGRIRLNRPKALHALNTDMCAAMLEALVAWRADTAIEAVLIDHSEGRGFCAGGDIRMIAESGAGDGAAARDFFRTEYRLNHALFTYAKPVVAFMDGITMGGGVGIAMPARYRVATENTKFAMPETGIGLFPDVGGGWYLARLPGHLGEFVALTGARLDGAECLALGIATHYLPAARLGEAKERIAADPQSIPVILEALAESAPEPKILAHRPAIDHLFAGDTVERILASLKADGSFWALAQLATLRTKSPQACKVSLRLVRKGRHMPSFEDEMRQEFAVASRVVQRPDFAEGVRAVIVDKDNAPRWQPAMPEGVTDHVINQIFAPLPADEEWTPI
ncbi:MAG: enoyl-CoA hydratase/isomerase family protein [Sphingomonas sp.]|uniref:enoyl-CoA hydratase/isomerase family protein n=1 Tax=Sphingomonas sp. TaxID=28214 RepID=UPI0022739662|nr:enoyl-CoA hydratase/isomerase family protein [Sphingomonas sp.]MCX8474896.1 enoyl-CoA hydratase/isomerase family protein [Sphingomonas sp.]